MRARLSIRQRRARVNELRANKRGKAIEEIIHGERCITHTSITHCSTHANNGREQCTRRACKVCAPHRLHPCMRLRGSRVHVDELQAKRARKARAATAAQSAANLRAGSMAPPSEGPGQLWEHRTTQQHNATSESRGAAKCRQQSCHPSTLRAAVRSQWH